MNAELFASGSLTSNPSTLATTGLHLSRALITVQIYPYKGVQSRKIQTYELSQKYWKKTGTLVYT